MPFSLFISHLIGGSVGSATLMAVTIIVGSFFFEDLTAVVVGVLAADGVISIPLALLSLFVGVLLSDLTLYCLGRVASAIRDSPSMLNMTSLRHSVRGLKIVMN